MNQSINKDALLAELVKIAKLGPVEAIGFGSNTIGKTLQAALGITHSVNNRNSKFGYTITSTKTCGNSGERTNLFACVADWNESSVKSSSELVKEYGRSNLDKGYEHSLFCTVSALSENGFGLKLSIEKSKRLLREVFVSESIERELLCWDTNILETKLKKLGHTAIVTGLPIDRGSSALSFHFRYVEILGQPKISTFLDLIEDGAITVDHCISQKIGSPSAREQGPLFKIRGDARGLLYDSIEKYDLLDL